jgi:hypothetical protein
MALGADADTHVLVRGTGLEHGAARAVDDSVVVFGMDLFFHG